jgi:hypothetical protein
MKCLLFFALVSACFADCFLVCRLDSTGRLVEWNTAETSDLTRVGKGNPGDTIKAVPCQAIPSQPPSALTSSAGVTPYLTIVGTSVVLRTAAQIAAETKLTNQNSAAARLATLGAELAAINAELVLAPANPALSAQHDILVNQITALRQAIK